MTTQTRRIHPLIADRWSPRAFDESRIAGEDLELIFQAAGLAPSAANKQPWRFLFAHRGDENWEEFCGLLNPLNQSWAEKSSALIFVLSDTRMDASSNDGPASHSHSFDAGAAWGLLALQSTALGYHTHAMTGIDFERARRVLQAPSPFRIEAAVAIGRRAAPEILPEPLRSREVRSTRKNVDEIAFAGPFPNVDRNA
jgi:nitroreductase